MVNEFDEESHYYKYVKIEDWFRTLTKYNSNAYVITFAACNRSVYPTGTQTGVSSGEMTSHDANTKVLDQLKQKEEDMRQA